MSDPNTFLPLTPAVYHILLALAAGDKHGYAIMQEAEELSDGQVKMGPGTLYGTIKRLLKTGLVIETASDDPRRRFYRLTELGHRVAKAESRRLARLVEAAQGRMLLDGAEWI